MEQSNNRKVILLGGVIGAATGLVAAYLLVRRAESDSTKSIMTPGEGVKLGLSILGLLKLISDKTA